ncbi:hypothetical protein [Glaciibacter superstes]|nr:hypothetical protein [Glaciibacter superstes]
MTRDLRSDGENAKAISFDVCYQLQPLGKRQRGGPFLDEENAFRRP